MLVLVGAVAVVNGDAEGHEETGLVVVERRCVHVAGECRNGELKPVELQPWWKQDLAEARVDAGVC